MRRIAIFTSIAVAIIAVILTAFYFFLNVYWVHRYDELIARQAEVYKLDNNLVWSVIYEETYFKPWEIGADGEIGLMQVTPTVAREWAKATGMKTLEKRANENAVELLRDPETNLQVGCWYLQKLRQSYRGLPGEEARALAAYNAGPSRVEEWSKTAPNDENSPPLTEQQFIERIDIPSTRSYVESILERYRKLKKPE
jgi:soluble lytic murein transglycosylase